MTRSSVEKQDISQHSRVPSENAQQIIDEQRREMDEFVSIVLHDLRRPLVSLFGLLSLMKDNRADRAEEIDDIILLLGECERMKRTIAMLTDFKKIDRAEIKRQTVQFKEMLDTIVHRFQREIDEKQARVRIDCPDAEGMIPRFQIETCLESLLDNALKYGCPKPNGSIEIRCCVDAGQVKISVRDEGPGIAPPDQKRVFELFRRLKNPANINGEGVGLAAVQKHLKRINGTVILNPSPGSGTEFTIAFPLAGE